MDTHYEVRRETLTAIAGEPPGARRTHRIPDETPRDLHAAPGLLAAVLDSDEAVCAYLLDGGATPNKDGNFLLLVNDEHTLVTLKDTVIAD